MLANTWTVFVNACWSAINTPWRGFTYSSRTCQITCWMKLHIREEAKLDLRKLCFCLRSNLAFFPKVWSFRFLPTHSHCLKTPIKRKVFVCGLLLSSDKDLIIEHHWHCGKKKNSTWQRGKALAWILRKSLFYFLSTFHWSHCDLCLLLQNQRSAHLFNVEINFHPVMLNLT